MGLFYISILKIIITFDKKLSIMESKNPFFKNKTFSTALSKSNDTVQNATVIDYNNEMTVSGTISKSFLLLLLLVTGASITWIMTSNGQNPIVFRWTTRMS